jgi:hypothetical protein
LKNIFLNKITFHCFTQAWILEECYGIHCTAHVIGIRNSLLFYGIFYCKKNPRHHKFYPPFQKDSFLMFL